MIIEIEVKNKIARLKAYSPIVTHNNNYVVKFSFDEEWSEQTTKTARFIWDSSYTDVVFMGDECVIPSIPATHKLEIGVFAEGLKSSTAVVIKPKESILFKSGTPVPSGDEYAEYMTKSRFWTGYSAFFDSLENVSAEAREAFDNVDISQLTTSQVEEKIEILNKMLASESGDDKNYIHTQSQSLNTWVIAHNLGKYPSVTVINSAGDEVVGDVKYDSQNQVTITFKGAFKGTAIFN